MKIPKPKEIELAEEYCNTRYGFNNHEYDAFLAGYDAAQKQLADADKVMPRWVSVKDRLPNRYKSVLVLCEFGHQVAYYRPNEDPEYDWFLVRDCEPLPCVTYWMELPELPPLDDLCDLDL